MLNYSKCWKRVQELKNKIQRLTNKVWKNKLSLKMGA